MISQDRVLLLICSCLHKMLLFPYKGISFIHLSESKLCEDHFQMPSASCSLQATLGLLPMSADATHLAEGLSAA